jgi:alkylation response protein AidB-like acyl-CoA dehydrogenase
MIELAILVEEMGRALAPVPFFSSVCLAAQVVAQCEPSNARDSFLRAVASGERRATLALGQRGGRFDERGVSVKAVRSGAGSWALTGTASLVPDAHVADVVVVVAKTAGGFSLLAVPQQALRSKPKPMPSLDGARRLTNVRFSGVEVPETALLGAEGEAWPAVARGLDRAAVLLAAEAVGVAAAVLDLAVAYSKERT